ncbi:alpha-N-acetylgalactosaminidase-like [Ylistrum balloti]|uniref:alpha-N-acetylgalactosaminidase-like n=1 Tax=Ylistrum balloti TaxID=509963 RepID=UPI002905D1F1|nr:alpha-N-acetylgalactosaminidase-like [Ylistrum balloti]
MSHVVYDGAMDAEKTMLRRLSEQRNQDDVFMVTNEGSIVDNDTLNNVSTEEEIPVTTNGTNDATTTQDETQQNETIKHVLRSSRKRKRDPENWKRNIRKRRCEHGQEYINSKGIKKPERKIKTTKDCEGKWNSGIYPMQKKRFLFKDNREKRKGTDKIKNKYNKKKFQLQVLSGKEIRESVSVKNFIWLHLIKNYNAMWHEGIAGRGGNEIASALVAILDLRADHFYNYHKSTNCLNFSAIPFTKLKALKLSRRPFHVECKTSFTEAFIEKDITAKATRGRKRSLVRQLPEVVRLGNKTVLSNEKKADLKIIEMITPLVILLALGTIYGLDNGLARTPPMGWLSWQRFRCNTDCENDPENCISEQLYKEMADRLVADGYAALGYQYINIDDCWLAKERDAEGRLQADPHRFPSGIKALADYMHNKSLKLGIYEDFGIKTCAGFPGSEFYMQLDADTFASWGVDSLKFDGCNSARSDVPIGYPIMRKFLNLTGRPILYTCEWPLQLQHPDYEAVAENCNVFRNYDDIQDSWDSITSTIKFYGDDKYNFSGVAGPGNFNDPDELVIGDFGLSVYQERVQMAMWAMFAAPLFMSNDLRNIRPESKALLQNKGVISVNQDPLGIQGRLVFSTGTIQVWIKPMAPIGNRSAFALLNLANGGSVSKVSVKGARLGLLDSRGYNITDAFTGDFVAAVKPNTGLTVKVNPSDVFLGIANLLV